MEEHRAEGLGQGAEGSWQRAKGRGQRAGGQLAGSSWQRIAGGNGNDRQFQRSARL